MQFFLQKHFQLFKKLWLWSELHICRTIGNTVISDNGVFVRTEMQWWSIRATCRCMSRPCLNCSSMCILVWLQQQTCTISIMPMFMWHSSWIFSAVFTSTTFKFLLQSDRRTDRQMETNIVCTLCKCKHQICTILSLFIPH